MSLTFCNAPPPTVVVLCTPQLHLLNLLWGRDLTEFEGLTSPLNFNDEFDVSALLKRYIQRNWTRIGANNSSAKIWKRSWNGIWMSLVSKSITLELLHGATQIQTLGICFEGQRIQISHQLRFMNWTWMNLVDSMKHRIWVFFSDKNIIFYLSIVSVLWERWATNFPYTHPNPNLLVKRRPSDR